MRTSRRLCVENEQGERESVFNRYDFLEQDEAGNWYYEDGFLFSVDENGTAQRNRQFILEDRGRTSGLGHTATRRIRVLCCGIGG